MEQHESLKFEFNALQQSHVDSVTSFVEEIANLKDQIEMSTGSDANLEIVTKPFNVSYEKEFTAFKINFENLELD